MRKEAVAALAGFLTYAQPAEADHINIGQDDKDEIVSLNCNDNGSLTERTWRKEMPIGVSLIVGSRWDVGNTGKGLQLGGQVYSLGGVLPDTVSYSYYITNQKRMVLFGNKNDSYTITVENGQEDQVNLSITGKCIGLEGPKVVYGGK